MSQHYSLYGASRFQLGVKDDHSSSACRTSPIALAVGASLRASSRSSSRKLTGLASTCCVRVQRAGSKDRALKVEAEAWLRIGGESAHQEQHGEHALGTADAYVRVLRIANAELRRHSELTNPWRVWTGGAARADGFQQAVGCGRAELANDGASPATTASSSDSMGSRALPTCMIRLRSSLPSWSSATRNEWRSRARV